MKLLNIDANAKTVKGQKRGFMTAVLYLAPSDLSGFNVCPNATPGCRAACLGWHAGRVAVNKAGEDSNPIRRARVAKTRWYFEDRAGFMAQLVKEITAAKRKAERAGLTLVVRLNGSSDIPFEHVPVADKPNIMAVFPKVQFYDYTKRANRRDLPPNYRLTFSLAEGNDAHARAALAQGLGVAAVFRKTLPDTYLGAPVINGDADDLRFLDPEGVVIGLVAKGAAKRDRSGFVRD